MIVKEFYEEEGNVFYHADGIIFTQAEYEFMNTLFKNNHRNNVMFLETLEDVREAVEAIVEKNKNYYTAIKESYAQEIDPLKLSEYTVTTDGTITDEGYGSRDNTLTHGHSVDFEANHDILQSHGGKDTVTQSGNITTEDTPRTGDVQEEVFTPEITEITEVDTTPRAQIQTDVDTTPAILNSSTHTISGPGQGDTQTDVKKSTYDSGNLIQTEQNIVSRSAPDGYDSTETTYSRPDTLDAGAGHTRTIVQPIQAPDEGGVTRYLSDTTRTRHSYEYDSVDQRYPSNKTEKTNRRLTDENGNFLKDESKTTYNNKKDETEYNSDVHTLDWNKTKTENKGQDTTKETNSNINTNKNDTTVTYAGYQSIDWAKVIADMYEPRKINVWDIFMNDVFNAVCLPIYDFE